MITRHPELRRRAKMHLERASDAAASVRRTRAEMLNADRNTRLLLMKYLVDMQSARLFNLERADYYLRKE